MNFKILDKDFVEKNLDTKECIKLMEKTLLQLHKGEFTQYLRTAQMMPCGGLEAFMPAYSSEGYFGAKILSVFPQNSKDGYPSHQGQIMLFESSHGVLLGLVDATSVTKIRTGAVSAAATKLLANKDSKIMTLYGSGEQAESHLAAICAEFELEEIRIWSRRPEKAEEFCRENAGSAGKAKLIPFTDAEEAAKDADIICTLTPSKEPLFSFDSLKKGVHINAVGSCSPISREIDTKTVASALFFCDSIESVLAEAGDFWIPKHEGAIDDDHIKGTIGQLLAGEIPGRTSKEDITVFESLGLAVEDLASAKYLLDISE